jgi:hypothetical protein
MIEMVRGQLSALASVQKMGMLDEFLTGHNRYIWMKQSLVAQYLEVI